MQILRKILFPFALIYGGVVFLRNKFYDWGVLSYKAYDIPVICVGNLSVGGTGKSPMIEYLVSLLKEEKKIATLSRGYKRSTSGFYLLSGNETAKEVGDEPLQFKTKYPEIEVAVHEKRQEGIYQLRQLNPQPEVILLDDAFQHRRVKAGFNILLTSYEDLYTDDFMLPTGNLREPRSGAKRAQVIIVTKCPSHITEKEMSLVVKKIRPLSFQSVYYTTINYKEVVTNGKEKIAVQQLPFFTLVTGIAKPKPLVEHLTSLGLNFQHLSYPDHHNFSLQEISELEKRGLVVTTEKDFMRLKNHLAKDCLFYLPIKTEFLKEEEKFIKQLESFVT